MRPGALLLALLSVGPEQWALPGFRVHLTVSERLDPDRLRALARPEVVLWVQTDSNLLKLSTREALVRAGTTWVQVRPPFRPEPLEAFRGRVGPWVLESGLDVGRFRRWAPGRVAVEVEGELSEAVLRRVKSLHPLAVRWRAPRWPEARAWARARRLPGLELMLGEAVTPDCSVVPRGIRARLRRPLSRALEESCGLAVRVEVPPGVEEKLLRALLVARPDAELAVEVGADPAAADAARRLLESLERSTPAAGRTAEMVRQGPRLDAGTR